MDTVIKLLSATAVAAIFLYPVQAAGKKTPGEICQSQALSSIAKMFQG
jgi:hypothetical protein